MLRMKNSVRYKANRLTGKRKTRALQALSALVSFQLLRFTLPDARGFKMTFPINQPMEFWDVTREKTL